MQAYFDKLLEHDTCGDIYNLCFFYIYVVSCFATFGGCARKQALGGVQTKMRGNKNGDASVCVCKPQIVFQCERYKKGTNTKELRNTAASA